MPTAECFPLRVEQVTAASFNEWRVGETLPAAVCDTWQMVYLFSGAVEERCDARTVTLRAGQLLLHPPGESAAMRAVGEVPPEVLRLDLVCGAAAIQELTGRALRTELGDRLCLQQLLRLLRETFLPAEPGCRPQLRADAPFGTMQLLCVYLEMLLIAQVRARRRARRPTAHARAEREQQMLVDSVQYYFSRNLDRELTVEQVCREHGCSRARLQKAFRARLHRGPMEVFAAMKMERARALLAGGCTPGEAAARLGFADGAYFSRCFRRSCGMTPREYRRRALAARAATNRQTPPPNVHVPKPDGEVE